MKWAIRISSTLSGAFLIFLGANWSIVNDPTYVQAKTIGIVSIVVGVFLIICVLSPWRRILNHLKSLKDGSELVKTITTMKVFKRIGLVFLIVGIACIAAAFIWAAVEPSSWDVLGPFFIGIFLLAMDLLGLLVFIIYRIWSIRKEL